MIIQSFFGSVAPILIAAIVFIITFLAIKKLSIPGTDFTFAILALFLAFILFSSTRFTNFLIKIIPAMAILLVASFLILVIMIFVSKDIDAFKKPLSWVVFALAIILILAYAFNQFPVLNHLLPYSSDSYLNSNMREFKDFIYSDDFRESLIFIFVFSIVIFFIFKKK